MSTVLFLGDPAVSAEAMVSIFVAQGYTGEVLAHQWRLPDSNAMVRANRFHEANGAVGLTDPDELGALIGPAKDDITGIVTEFFPVSADLIDLLPALKFIGTVRSGTQNVDTEAAKRCGIDVHNNPGRNAPIVADFAVGLMFAASRGIALAHHLLQSGTWMSRADRKDLRTVSGSTIGLVGYGAVGRRVAELSSGFGGEVLVYDPYQKVEISDGQAMRQVEELDDLLEASQIVSLHARVTPATVGLIGRRELDLIGDGVLVNTARADLIDEGALIAALREQTLRWAALDVFSEEPLPPDHELRGLPNVTLTPHIAGSDRNALAVAVTLLADRLRAVTDETLWSSSSGGA
jgi:D-3-phosphoglycerate dehydrogenase / 2-oxoglutarate reductase